MTMSIGKWSAALTLSAVIHAGTAGWFYQPDNDEKIQGGAPVEISILGDAFQSEMAAGDPDETAEPIEPENAETKETEETETPEEIVEETPSEVIEAEMVEPDTAPTVVEAEITPITETDVVEVIEPNILSAQPSKVEAVSEAEPVQQMPSEMVAFAEPQPTELLKPEIQLADINVASVQPALFSDKTISPPLLEAEITPVDKEEPVMIDEVKPDNSEAESHNPVIEKIEPEKPELVVKPEISPAKKMVSKKKKPVKAKKLVKKKKPKKVKKKAKKKPGVGSKGKSKRNARAGDSEGLKSAKTNAAGKTRGKRARRSGNASASNYKGKVRRKIDRRLKHPRGRKKSTTTGRVFFVLSTSGAVKSVKLVRSSGYPKLDKLALASVRRSSPFPKPPNSMRGASLGFTFPFFSRR